MKMSDKGSKQVLKWMGVSSIELDENGKIIPETRDLTHLNFFSATEKMRKLQYPPSGSKIPDGYFLQRNPDESEESYQARRAKAFLCPLDKDFIELERRKPDSIAVRLYKEVRNAPEETGQSFLSSANVKTFIFNLTNLSNLTCCDNIHLETIGDKKTALFIIISATDPTFRFLAAMLYSQLFDVLSNRANFLYGGRLPVHVRCIMDEFANCGEIPNFNGIISFVRGMNMSLNVIIQNMSQLKSRYEKTWEEIPGNCDSILFLGGKEESTLKSISEQLGKETIDVRGQNRTRGKSPSTSENNSILGRELLQINEVGNIPTTACILMMRGHNPFYCLKYVPEEHPNYRFTGDADKANIYELSSLRTKTFVEYHEEQKQKRERQAAQAAKREERAKVDTPVNLAERDTGAGVMHEIFDARSDKVTIIIPTTFEEILEFIKGRSTQEKEKSFESIKSIPASFCLFQPYSLICLPVCSSSSTEISFLKYFSRANFNSLFLPILGNPATDVLYAIFFSCLANFFLIWNRV